MFFGCSKMEYINFKISELKELQNKNDIFGGISSNLIICSEKEDWSIFFSRIKTVECNNMGYKFKCYTNNLNIIYSKYFCEMCYNHNKKFFMKFMDSNNIETCINCYNSPEGFYLDLNDLLYKSCYESCKNCDISGNEEQHNCFECKSDYSKEYQITTYKNCYKYITKDSTNNIINEKDTQNEIRTELIQDFTNNLINEFNFSDINNIINKKLFKNNTKYIFSPINSQYENNSYIDLGQCKDILKDKYNISNFSTLYILLIINEEKGMNIPKVEYEIYYHLYSNNLIQLNLSLCQGTKIEIYNQVKINDILDKYNPSSDYYNDICYKTTSESGTDISLKKRRNNFIQNNLTLCEENCALIEYNYTQEKVKCSCDIKVSLHYDIKFNKEELYKNFMYIKNDSILNCFKIVWKIKELIKNYCFFFILFILILYFIVLFLFWLKLFPEIKKDINYINYFLKKDIKGEEQKESKIKNNKKRLKPIVNRKISNNNRINIINNNINNRNDDNNVFVFKNENITKNPTSSDKIIQNRENKEMETENENNLKLKGLDDIYIKELLKQKEFEINSLDYNEAINLDHRTYLEYYIYLLKYNHQIMLLFAPFIDYNSRIIKIFLFFFLVNLCHDINVLFFSTNVIDKIYEDKGKYNFSFQIPQILYSALISKFIDSLIKFLALSQDNIVEFKKEKKKQNSDNNYIIKIIRNLKIKFIAFFCIAFIIIVFFWFYLTCFCGVYENTQKHFTINSIISFIISLLLPFITYLIPGIFRILALRAEKNNKRLLYNFSSFLEKILR